MRTLTVRVSGSTTLLTRITFPEKVDPGKAGTVSFTPCPNLTRWRSFSNTLASIQTRERSIILKRLASVPTLAPIVALRSTTIPSIGELREKTAARSGLLASESIVEGPSDDRRAHGLWTRRSSSLSEVKS